MANIDTNPLTAEQFHQLLQALRFWVKRHSAPDDPVLSFAGGSVLSPRQIVSQVAERTSDGRAFLRMVQVALEVESFERLLAGFSGLDRFER